jgi:hypothetical protein
MNTLLNRLKQSISSTRVCIPAIAVPGKLTLSQDFAAFLKERSALEDKHSQALKKLSRNTHDSIGRPEGRQGSFANNYKELTTIHERMADHGLQFSGLLFTMADELSELASSSEKSRKQWKATGVNAEKRVQDAEAIMEKAKNRYSQLAENYDRARTGERASSGKFGLKKSGPQAEEEIRYKLEAADADYRAKVEALQQQKAELMSTHRPQTINALQETIREIDAGLSSQIQRFANLSEKLMLGFGLCITPMKGQSPIPGQPPDSRSLREVASSINNERDFNDYVLGFANKAPSRPSEVKYEQHPSLSPKQQQPANFYSDDSYGQQNYPANHGRQVSGVTPYPGENEYGGGQNYGAPQMHRPPGPSQTPSLPPQLPQMTPSTSGFGMDSDQSGSYQPEPPLPGHARNVSSIGSVSSLGGPSQDMRSVSPQPGMGSGQSSGPPSQQMGMGRGQPPLGRGAPQGMGRGGAAVGMGRGTGPGMGPGHSTAPTTGPSSSMAGVGGLPSQTSMNTGPMSQPGPNSGTSMQGGMGRGQPPPGGMGRGSTPSSAMAATGSGPPGSYTAPGAMGRGQTPVGRGAPQGVGMGRGGPPTGQTGPGLQSNVAPQAGRGMGTGPGPQSTMPPQAGRGMGPGPASTPPNGAPRTGPVAAGGINALPSRRAAAPTGPPVNPVFNVSLDALYSREGSAVPIIVMQCIQAVELFGLNVEGIYRTSGSANHMMELRQQFDHGTYLPACTVV